MKYSRAVSPSRKFDLMGDSMISPIWPVSFFAGFAIRPRIPASCRIWSLEPRAPESAIMWIGLNPPLASSIAVAIASATSLAACVHVSTTLL